MSESELSAEELSFVRRRVDIAAGLRADREDLRRAALAEREGGRFRKVGPGMYEIAPPEAGHRDGS